jgi:hypothetical protein
LDAEQASCQHADLPIAELDQLLDRRQPDAGAFVGAPARALDAMETVEDPRHLRFGNVRAGIADSQLPRRKMLLSETSSTSGSSGSERLCRVGSQSV